MMVKAKGVSVGISTILLDPSWKIRIVKTGSALNLEKGKSVKKQASTNFKTPWPIYPNKRPEAINL